MSSPHPQPSLKRHRSSAATQRRHIERARLLMSALVSPEPLSPLTLTQLSHPLTVKLALDEGLGGALFTLLNSAEVQGLSAHVEERLLGAHLQAVWLEEARLRGLARHWPRELPPPLLMKGASYSARCAGARAIWGEGERAASDLDLLIPTSWERASPALKPLMSTTERGEPQGACVSLHLDELLVECHLSVAPRWCWPSEGPLSARALWERGREVELSVSGTARPLAVRVPPLIDQLAIALAQLLKGGGGLRVRDWVDLTRLLCAAAGEVEATADSSAWRSAGLNRALVFALARLEETPGWGQLTPELRALARQASPNHAQISRTHPLSGATPNWLERLYTRTSLLRARPLS